MSPSSVSEGSMAGDQVQREVDISDDEYQPTPDPPAFSGLFPPDLFKSLLCMVRATAQLGEKESSKQGDKEGTRGKA